MFVAQSRMFNHELFVKMRQLLNEQISARLAQVRRELRQEQADKLAPLEIRLTPTAKPPTDGQDGKDQDGGRTP